MLSPPHFLVTYFLAIGAQPQLQPQLPCAAGAGWFWAPFFLAVAIVLTSFLFKYMARYLYSDQ